MTQHTLLSVTTPAGDRTHTVTTPDRDLYFAVFEQALEVDNEPESLYKKGVYTVGFICSDKEAAAAIEAATSNAARGLVGVA